MHRPTIPAPVLAPASALVWWVVGYLPWLVDGLGDDVPGVVIDSVAWDAITIPLLTSELPLLVLGAVVGGACAGLLITLTDGRPATAFAASFAGVAGAVLLTGIQASSAVRDAGGGGYEADDAVISALLATTAGASLLGWLFGSGGFFGRAPLGIALAGLAGALPSWLTSLVFAIDPDVRSEVVSSVITYAGAGLLATALVVIGVRPYLRLVAWPVAVALAWIVPPAFTAAGYLSVMLRPPAELSDALGPAWEVFGRAVRPANTPTDWLVPFVVAIGLAVAISIRLELRDRKLTLEA